ncbi:ankyrin repeat domain-containing protein 13D [Sergentomyia squamirostris]
MVTIDDIKRVYPLHWHVWNNEVEQLKEALAEENGYDVEKKDPRGRTPLMLAVRLGHLECIQTLLPKANTAVECDGWSVVQESVCTGNPDILTAVLEVRDLNRFLHRQAQVPRLLQLLHDAPDFYVEMKWEFTTWVPLMSRFCPSDVYRIYKSGSNVRIDTTLLTFEQTYWKRGHRSYIFIGELESARMIEVNHDKREASVEYMDGMRGEIDVIPPSAELVQCRMRAPVTSNVLDIEKISFERNKSGIWGWRSEKNENITGYDCKVYSATNVEFITRSRTEHLPEDAAKSRNRTTLFSIFGVPDEDTRDVPAILNGDLAEGVRKEVTTPSPTTIPAPKPPMKKDYISPEEYFSEIDLGGRDVGRQKKISTKVQKFKANLWLSEDFPMNLQEQVIPILEIMSTIMSSHVSKLKDFITMQLPAGFPVKIEIPLFHIMNACVTFGNPYGLETPVADVNQIQEDDRMSCVIADQVFNIPEGYQIISTDEELARSGSRRVTDDDELLQYAIEQSLIDAGSENEQVDIWEALRAQRPLTPGGISDEDSQLQRALHESLNLKPQTETSNGDEDSTPSTPSIDPDLAMALRLSQEEQEKRQLDLKREEEMLARALQLSMEEK